MLKRYFTAQFFFIHSGGRTLLCGHTTTYNNDTTDKKFCPMTLC
jgi:hypothetical protein